MPKVAAAIPFALVACCCFVPRAFCQTETATISGRLTDPSGTTVAGAEIRLENLDQVTVLRTDSNKNGVYAFSSVPPGRYPMSVRKAGFRSVKEVNIVVNVQERLEEDFQLHVGRSAEYTRAKH